MQDDWKTLGSWEEYKPKGTVPRCRKAWVFILLGATYPIITALFPGHGHNLVEDLVFSVGGSQSAGETLQGLTDLVSAGCLLLGIGFLIACFRQRQPNKQLDPKGTQAKGL
jgi:hypothetical protein